MIIKKYGELFKTHGRKRCETCGQVREALKFAKYFAYGKKEQTAYCVDCYTHGGQDYYLLAETDGVWEQQGHIFQRI